MSEFIFRLADGREVARARDLKEFLACIKQVPLESLEYHFFNNHFYPWLKDNGYGRLVPRFRFIRAKNGNELRNKLVACIEKYMKGGRRNVEKR